MGKWDLFLGFKLGTKMAVVSQCCSGGEKVHWITILFFYLYQKLHYLWASLLVLCAKIESWKHQESICWVIANIIPAKILLHCIEDKVHNFISTGGPRLHISFLHSEIKKYFKNNHVIENWKLFPETRAIEVCSTISEPYTRDKLN